MEVRRRITGSKEDPIAGGQWSAGSFVAKILTCDEQGVVDQLEEMQ